MKTPHAPDSEKSGVHQSPTGEIAGLPGIAIWRYTRRACERCGGEIVHVADQGGQYSDTYIESPSNRDWGRVAWLAFEREKERDQLPESAILTAMRDRIKRRYVAVLIDEHASYAAKKRIREGDERFCPAVEGVFHEHDCAEKSMPDDD